mmetsp:Transcript_85688/g.220569  ORF Transcript_85688/g.220569 Transcript_85688/m.220569 type:complete len:290 (+) Transcript_85688:2834-3703(+)
MSDSVGGGRPKSSQSPCSVVVCSFRVSHSVIHSCIWAAFLLASSMLQSLAVFGLSDCQREANFSMSPFMVWMRCSILPRSSSRRSLASCSKASSRSWNSSNLCCTSPMSTPLATERSILFFSSADSSCFLASPCLSMSCLASCWALPSSCTESGRTLSFSRASSRKAMTILTSSLTFRFREMTRLSVRRSNWSSTTDFSTTVLIVKQSILMLSGILSISFRFAFKARKFMSQSLGSVISSTISCTRSGISPTTSHGWKEFCIAWTRWKSSSAFWKTTAMPASLRSGMAL